MNIIKLLYGLSWLFNSYAFAQPICKDGDFYCFALSKCLHKGELCENECNSCIDKQQMGLNIECIDECKHELDNLNNDCLDYTRCLRGYEIKKENDICTCYKPICIYEYVCPVIEELNIKNNNMNDYSVYKISLNLQKENSNLYAIYGQKNHVMTIPAAYQLSNHQGVDIGGINPLLQKYIKNTQYDSWLTIQVTDGEIIGKVDAIGIDFSSWDKNHGITVTDGAIFLDDPTLKLSETNKYVIGQLTLKDSEDHQLIINVQGRKNINNQYSDSYRETNVVFNFEKKNNITDSH